MMNRKGQLLVFFFSLVGFFFICIQSQSLGGISFDEHIEAWGAIDTLRFARKALVGVPAGFDEIVENLEFYGIVNKLPGLFLWVLAGPGRLQSVLGDTGAFDLVGDMGRQGYYALSHFTSILFFLLTVLLLVPLSRLVGVRNWLIPSVLCLWWPSFAGHALMNIKDIPFAFFYTAYTFLLASSGCKFWRGLAFPLRACVAAAMISMKLPAFLPILLSEIFAFVFSLGSEGVVVLKKSLTSQGSASHRVIPCILVPIASMVRFSAVVGLMVYAMTPASWRQPLRYAADAFSLHSNHYWGGCTWLNGSCSGKAVDPGEWSALRYALSWFLVQTPALVLLLLALGFGSCVIYVLTNRPTMRALGRNCASSWPACAVALQAFLMPLMAFAANSTLYGSLRHLTFAIPGLSILVIYGSEYFFLHVRRWRKRLRLLVAGLACVMVLDMCLLSPFGYVYINEPARFLVDLKRTEMDYWGFSSGELMRAVARREPDQFGLVNGYRPMISVYHEILGRADVPGGPRFSADFTVDALAKDISECRAISQVRRPLLGGVDLLLSRAYICDQKSS